MATPTPVQRPTEHLEVRISHLGASQVPSIDQGLFHNLEPQQDFYEEDFSHSIQAVSTEFNKFREPKVAKLKEVIPLMPALCFSHG